MDPKDGKEEKRHGAVHPPTRVVVDDSADGSVSSSSSSTSSSDGETDTELSTTSGGAVSAAVAVVPRLIGTGSSSALGENERLLKQARDDMTNIELIARGGDLRIEPTHQFMAHISAVGKLYKRYIGLPHSLKAIPAHVYVSYWMQAPGHHFNNVATSTTRLNAVCVADNVWIAQAHGEACTKRRLINKQICENLTMGSIAIELAAFRHSWPLKGADTNPPFPGRQSTLREVAIAALVFYVPLTQTRLYSIGFLGAPLPRARSEADGEGKYPAGEEKEAEDGISAAEAAARKAINNEIKRKKDPKKPRKPGSVPGDKRVDDDEPSIAMVNKENAVKKLAICMKKLREGADAQREWIQLTASVFQQLDAIECLSAIFKPIHINELKTEHRVHGETQLRKWLAKRCEWVPVAPFQVAYSELACELALPLATFTQHRRRSPTSKVSFQSLYASEYYDEEAADMEDKSNLPLNDILDLKWESTLSVTAKAAPATRRLRYIRDALIFHTYHFHFSNALGNERNWRDDFLVTNSELRAKASKLFAISKGGMYMIVQLGSVYYVHNGKNLIQMPDPITALWFWTYSLRMQYADKLPPYGHAMGPRWTDKFGLIPKDMSPAAVFDLINRTRAAPSA